MAGSSRHWLLDEQLPPAARETIHQGVALQSRQLTQGSDAQDIACALYDDDDLLAGAWGRTEFQRLYVAAWWVEPAHRGQGLGAECLRRIEALALKRGCVDALIETLNDEAADIAEHMGYVCVAHVHDYVPGLTRHTLLKVWQPR
jgi:GNAT superfamily N-acetyltransferase